MRLISRSLAATMLLLSGLGPAVTVAGPAHVISAYPDAPGRAAVATTAEDRQAVKAAHRAHRDAGLRKWRPIMTAHKTRGPGERAHRRWRRRRAAGRG